MNDPLNPAPPTCDWCGSPVLRRHCAVEDSRTCDWMKCRRCGSYGIPGKRMVDNRPKEMR